LIDITYNILLENNSTIKNVMGEFETMPKRSLNERERQSVMETDIKQKQILILILLILSHLMKTAPVLFSSNMSVAEINGMYNTKNLKKFFLK